MSISVVIIALNEERNIRRCLGSVSWADEIILADTGSTDMTSEIAASMGARVVGIGWDGFGPTKQRAADIASGDWILSLDADEEIPPSLAREIRTAIGGSGDIDGYFLPRRTCFFGNWIEHSGWYPDYVLRLFRRGKGAFADTPVHEKIEVPGRVEKLKSPILHYSYRESGAYFDRANRYAELGAQRQLARKADAGLLKMIFSPPASFYRHFIGGRGFLDGPDGFLIAVLSALGTLKKYRKLLRLKAERDD